MRQMPDECVDCQDAKAEASSKASATKDESGGLQLGECSSLYKQWAECVEQSNGQVRACAETLAEFRKCHRRLAGAEVLRAAGR